MLHVWITALISTSCWSFNTSRGKIEGNCDPELFSKKPQRLRVFFFLKNARVCLCIWTQSIAYYMTLHCKSSLSSSTPMCPVDIIPERNGSSLQSCGESTLDIFYLEVIAALSHVEGSCCLRTLTNTRWFQSGRTEERLLLYLLLLQYYFCCKYSMHPQCIKC